MDTREDEYQIGEGLVMAKRKELLVEHVDATYRIGLREQPSGRYHVRVYRDPGTADIYKVGQLMSVESEAKAFYYGLRMVMDDEAIRNRNREV